MRNLFLRIKTQNRSDIFSIYHKSHKALPNMGKLGSHDLMGFRVISIIMHYVYTFRCYESLNWKLKDVSSSMPSPTLVTMAGNHV